MDDITKENTQWLFMLTSSQKPEDRHIYDIVFGITILLKKGIPINNISLVMDDDSLRIRNIFFPLLGQNTVIHNYDKLPSLLASLNRRYIMIIVTGHGSIEGIDARLPIKPYQFLYTIKQYANASTVLLFLGQCYAGIFDHLEIQKEQKRDGTYTPEIIIIGATKIAVSMSTPVEYGDISWYANILLVAFFRWIDQPYDIDGDSKYSITDAFKFIAYHTNGVSHQIEKQQYSKILQHLEQYKRLKEIPYDKLSLDEHITKEAFEGSLPRGFIPQEPWILNPLLALKINVGL
ncbi:hypothetical protein [Treponema sp. OMZ 855]|uniref:hypothetical protein n=1 Tax=Treponema sp. OMZ 855 TaxID=1643512 RepID=UPI0020A3F97A|nr:hypothetical protein [Treponema sp. OMZ 855]UTC49845.1 hypothetical protein E4N65_06930 [Treponema sp. OMZ 855]